MNTRTWWAGVTLALFLGLIPVAASAQSISIEARQQLLTLAQQLVQILNELSIARSYGAAYLNSAQFAQQGASWIARLSQIQQQVSSVLSSATAYPSYAYPSASGFCPSLYRDLEPGMQGSDVADLQRFLASNPSARFSGSITASYDQNTIDALQRFQYAYGLILSGDWNTTGYGRLGSATRSRIASVCSQNVYPTNTVPAYPAYPSYPAYPTYPTTPSIGDSTASISVQRTSSLGARGYTFTIYGNPNAGCTATRFNLDFTDGTQQTVNFPASCSSQTQTVTHNFSTSGNFTVALTSGTFRTTVAVNVPRPNYSLTLSAAKGGDPYSVILTATFNPGGDCTSASYELDWGDGNDRTITFSDECSTRTRTFDHTYNGGGTYQIWADDDNNNSTGITFTATSGSGTGTTNTGTPTISSVSPDSVFAGQTVILTGANFTSANTVLLNGGYLGIFGQISTGVISFTVPSSQAPGSYGITVSNTNGASSAATLTVKAATQQFNVDTPTGCVNGYCSCVVGGQPGTADPAAATAICVQKGYSTASSYQTRQGVAGQTHCNANGNSCFVNPSTGAYTGNLVCTTVTCTR